MTVLNAVWEGMKLIGTPYYKLRKGKDKELQKELKKARESQTHVDMNDQFQAKPPARNGQKVRVLSAPWQNKEGRMFVGMYRFWIFFLNFNWLTATKKEQ